MKEPIDVIAPMVWLVALVWLALLLLSGCVTRATVCVETSHAVGRSGHPDHRDSVGASVCADVERP